MKRFLPVLMTAVFAAMSLSSVPAAAAQAEPIRIYVDEYAEGQVMSHVAKQVIETTYDVPVELKMVAVGPAFLGVANDDRSLFLVAWLPRTHGAYMDRVGDDVDNLGELFDGARLGWAVPAYVPEDALASIADMKDPAVAEKLGGSIQGISAGAGLMQVSKETIDGYGLDDDYRLITASSAAMTAALKRAIDNKEWIAVTAWSPHWMWERFDLRYLDDPKGVLGGREHVDAIASKGLAKSEPEVHAMLKRMHYTLDQINTALVNAEETSYAEAAQTFIDEHPDVIAEWTGRGAQNQSAGN
ncbi:glycine betaine ABC transporter substrate-binding protein [Endozoicomonas sp. G2_2]|uniref:glycine betaine ABC transporter substrate-binding protein n=1 Tax=Endozoicomonas sp. G2_2 TaxID=2821092 RepID=UPI001ADBFF0F|nr:glycine betaine ABC transporter substrate-binding protein [Endozoicomonas sp. G2_2]MBO9468723.1 glycine betaine ABC transporter substrate-binding protein [Endozoicomonas sp. G2_2]